MLTFIRHTWFTLTGSSNILPKVDFVDIPEKLKKLKTAYESERYKANFDWIDNLKELKDPGLINSLKEELLKDLQIRNNSKIHLAPPYILNWEDFEGYAFNSQKDDLKTDFDIDDYYDYKEDKMDDISWANVQASSIYIKYGDKDEKIPYPFWRFLNYETEINDIIYVFTLGRWYQVNKDYVQEVKDFIDGVEESDMTYVSCPYDMHEGPYNERLANSDADFLLFDKNLMKSDYYNRSHIEVCDVFSISRKELVHVKPRSSSSTLSHLFAQGKVSSYALIRDKSFRKNLRTKLNSLGADRNLVPLERRDLDTNEYTITFALIDKKDRSFIEALPFFSLLNFRLTFESLQNFGFKVKVKNIVRESEV